MLQRERVLLVYRKILRLSRQWRAQKPADTEREREYIREEARTLFRRHAQVNDPTQARQYLQEAEARLEMGLHYRNPYPRPVNLPAGVFSPRPGKPVGSVQQRKISRSRPVYLRSKDEELPPT